MEAIDEVEELPPASQRTLRLEFGRAEQDLDGWTRIAATLLSGLVNNVALVTFPRERESHVVRVNLVPVQETLVFLVVVLQEVKLRKQPAHAGRASIGRRPAGRRQPTERRAGRPESTADPFEDDADVARGAHGDGQGGGHDGGEDNALYSDHQMEGLARLLGQPEFAQSEKVREIVEALEDRELPAW